MAEVWPDKKATSDAEFLKDSCYALSKETKDVIQSSFACSSLEQNHITPSENGLVYAAYHAYSDHNHLTLRPDDIWLAVLSQTGFFINAHAEELRRFFVSHEGQKELCVVEAGSLNFADFGQIARRMTEEIPKNLIDSELKA